MDDWYLLKGRTTSGEMEIGGFMGLASLTKLVSYKLNKRPCLREVKWKGSEGKTTDVSFCHTHTSCTHIQPCAHKSQLWGMGSSENSPQGMVSGTPFIFTLLSKQSVAIALTLDLWKQWGRRQGQHAYYLCVLPLSPACLRSGQPPMAPGSFGDLFSFAGQPLRGQRCSFPHTA